MKNDLSKDIILLEITPNSGIPFFVELEYYGAYYGDSPGETGAWRVIRASDRDINRKTLIPAGYVLGNDAARVLSPFQLSLIDPPFFQ